MYEVETISASYNTFLDFHGSPVVKMPHSQCRRHGFHPWFRKIPWRRKWPPIPVFLPGKSHGQRSLVGYSSWGHSELDTTERLSMHTYFLLACMYLVLILANVRVVRLAGEV